MLYRLVLNVDRTFCGRVSESFIDEFECFLVFCFGFTCPFIRHFVMFLSLPSMSELVGWFVGRLIGWLVGPLTSCLVAAS